MPFVYILQCGDGSLYTGWTVDLQRRLAAHRRGTASKYTCAHQPVRLVYAESASDRSKAMRREYEIKSLTRPNKWQLITKCSQSCRARLAASAAVPRQGHT